MKSAIAFTRAMDQLLSAYVDHEATPEEIVRVEEHTRDCRDCRDRLREMQALERRVQTLVREMPHPSRDFRPPPTLLLGEVRTPWFPRVATVAVIVVFALLSSVVLLHSAPALPTGAPPTPTPSATVQAPTAATTDVQRLVDPTTAYLFFVLGLFAVFVEVAHPGALVPGITGLVSLAIAGVAFSTLPVTWPGIASVIGGVALMAIELKASQHGVLVLVGVVLLGAGSLVLYSQPGLVSPWVLLGVVVVGLVVGFLLVRLAQRIRQLPALIAFEHLEGARGVARTGLNPDGVVHVQGQMWSAHSRSGSVAAGEPVRVLARRGLVLDVESASFRAAATQKGAF